MENFVGAPTRIEPASPAFRAGMLTTTPQHPGTMSAISWTSMHTASNRSTALPKPLHHSTLVPSVSNLLVPIIHGRWCCNMMLLLQCLHTVRAPPILLYRHYSPDQLISRTRGPITRYLSVHGDPNVNPKWNNMSATSWTSRHTASNRSTSLPKGSRFAMLLLLLLTFSAFLAACIVLEFWVFMLLLERVLREIAEEREEQEFQFFYVFL